MMSVLLSLLLTLRGCVHSRPSLQLELLALRHQLQVLERSRPRRLHLSVEAENRARRLGVPINIVTGRHLLTSSANYRFGVPSK
jgi:hypothetical protein